MQETKGECCEECVCGMLRESDRICHDESCTCHNSSDTFIEEVRQTAAMNKRMGANEFKQKVLEALPKEEPTEQRTERFVNYNHFGAGFNRALSEIRTIISNLEV